MAKVEYLTQNIENFNRALAKAECNVENGVGRPHERDLAIAIVNYLRMMRDDFQRDLESCQKAG